MTTTTRTTTTPKAATKRTANATKTMSAATPRKMTTKPTTSAKSVRTTKPTMAVRPTTSASADDTPKALVERVRVQADLAGMEARDQWHRIATEIERRRNSADQAVRDLLDGGADASRTFANGVRDAVEELRVAVDAAVKALR